MRFGQLHQLACEFLPTAVEMIQIASAARIDNTACVNPLRAIEPAAVRVHAACASNIALDWEDGDLAASQAAFAHAHHVASVDLADPPMTACALEPKAALAQWDEASQRMTLVASTQGVMLVRKILAEHVFKRAPEQVRVITPNVGGGFGVKAQTYPEYAAILYASRLLRRPGCSLGCSGCR
jgi:carbon-monoxide dehydrogenase large subunit